MALIDVSRGQGDRNLEAIVPLARIARHDSGVFVVGGKRERGCVAELAAGLTRLRVGGPPLSKRLSPGRGAA